VTIAALVKVVPPPSVPSEAYYGPWGPIEAEIGTALPRDYKDFVRLYGRGRFMQFLGVYVPRAQSRYVRLEAAIRVVCGIAFHRDELPFPLWPDAEGLIPFGSTDDGDYLFWLARGEPADWRVVVWDRAMQGLEVFDCDLTDFLAGLATGRILPKEFPDLLPNECLFKPSCPVPDWRRRLPFAGSNPLRLSWRLGQGGSGPSGVSALRMRSNHSDPWTET